MININSKSTAKDYFTARFCSPRALVSLCGNDTIDFAVLQHETIGITMELVHVVRALLIAFRVTRFAERDVKRSRSQRHRVLPRTDEDQNRLKQP